jgi:predicted outer membrane lipoprotein
MLNTVAVLFMIPAVLILVPQHGAIAAAWVWVGVNVGYLVFGIVAMHRRILVLEKWSWYWRDVLGPALACALAAAAMWLLHRDAAGMPRLQHAAFLLCGTFALALATAAATPAGRQFLRSSAGIMLRDRKWTGSS